MDGLLSLIIVCVSFAFFICIVTRSVKPLILTAIGVIVYFALRANGVLGQHG